MVSGYACGRYVPWVSDIPLNHLLVFYIATVYHTKILAALEIIIFLEV